MSTLLTTLAFSAGFLLVFAVNLLLVDLFDARRQHVRQRLDEEIRSQQRVRAQSALQHKGVYELAAAAALDASNHVTIQERLERFLDQSGARINPDRVIVFTAAGGIGGGMVGFVLGGWLLGLLVAAIGAVVPLAYLSYLRARRLKKLRTQLPEVFDLMSRMLRAGRTIPQAFQSVGDEFQRPSSEEFGYAYEQQNLGLSPEATMRDLARRTGLLEMKIFVMAVMVHQQTGGNLADLLDKLSHILRERFRIQGMIKSLTAEGRLQATILLGLPPFLLVAVSVINRPYMTALFEFPMLLFGMFGFMAVGAVWMHRIIYFDF